uniref:Rhomboid domain-containing protein n=1 Tax=Macrostomum lignano TaxID=282301 RepID=A0A1I8FGI3_9PLAT
MPKICPRLFGANRLTESARRLAWRGPGILGAGGFRHRVWDLPAVGDSPELRSLIPTAMLLPFMGGTARLSRWSLLGPYAVVLMLSSCVFAAWRIFGLASLQPPPPPPLPLRPASWYFLRPNQLHWQNVAGEFVAFSVAAAYATSLASVLAMTLANRFVFSLGASGVTVGSGGLQCADCRPECSARSSNRRAAVARHRAWLCCGVIPLPWLTPAVGLSVWAGVEAVSWMVTVWRGRLPRLNHPAHLAGIGHRKFSHLSNISSCCYADLPLPLLPQPALARLSQRLLPLLRPSRRCLKASPRPSPNGQQQQQRGQPKPKLFFRRIGQLAESPVSTEPLSLSAGGHALPAGRQGRRSPGSGRPGVRDGQRATTWATVGIQEDDGLDKIVQDLRWTSPALLYCGLALAIHSLLGSRRMPLDKLAKLSRHALDQPGRSAILTSPWLSSVCEFQILAFIAGSLTGSAFRCAYQQSLLLLSRERRPLGHWCGPHAGLAALVALHLLSLRSVTAKVHSKASWDRRSRHSLDLFARLSRVSVWAVLSSADWLGSLQPGLLGALSPVAGAGVGPAAPALKHASTLAGLAAACGIHAAIEYRTQAVAELPAASDSAPNLFRLQHLLFD